LICYAVIREQQQNVTRNVALNSTFGSKIAELWSIADAKEREAGFVLFTLWDSLECVVSKRSVIECREPSIVRSRAA
jgi:hypothetical protein